MIDLRVADITTLAVDAIVNAANERFRGGGGVDGAIHQAAGPELLAECQKTPRLPTGTAVLTGGYRLPARYVIHTVGPVWQGGDAGEPELLRSAYRSVFDVARRHGDIRSLAFPAISTGVYGYPPEKAAAIAVEEMKASESGFELIVACVFDMHTAELYGRYLHTNTGSR